MLRFNLDLQRVTHLCLAKTEIQVLLAHRCH